jgi:hypothetical protein
MHLNPRRGDGVAPDRGSATMDDIAEEGATAYTLPFGTRETPAPIEILTNGVQRVRRGLLPLIYVPN